jgi:hypothetical protein
MQFAIFGSAEAGSERPGAAGEVRGRISRFPLNARHLDVQFQDGSRWEARFGDR